MNIAGDGRAQHLSDAQLASIISNGVPGTGMPGFHSLTPSQIRAVIGYVRTLQGKGEGRALPGDAKRGQDIFFGKGECANCHTISGQGGFLGPDLTNYGATASVDGIRDEIVKSPRVPSHGYRVAVVTTVKGEQFEGLIRNEDNFSVQLQTKDGSFHLLKKADLQTCESRDGSLMPTNYRDRLSPSELNDLVAYLMKTSNRGKGKKGPENKDDFE